MGIGNGFADLLLLARGRDQRTPDKIREDRLRQAQVVCQVDDLERRLPPPDRSEPSSDRLQAIARHPSARPPDPRP